jgi:hypothetical protein
MSHVTVEIRKAPFVDEVERKRAFKEEVLNYPRDEILQIRGKGNAPVPERYQQAIADFLNSREWERVGDLDNAGIYKVYDTYMTDRDVRPLLKRTVARVAKQDGYTPAQLDSQLRQIDEMDARGVQWAVNRRIQDLEHTLRMERVAAKRGEN